MNCMSCLTCPYVDGDNKKIAYLAGDCTVGVPSPKYENGF